MRPPKKGDLIRVKNSGIMYCVTRNPYTRRFIDQSGHEMTAHGFGEYTDIYAAAIDVICTKTSKRKTIRLDYISSIEVISAQEA